MLEMTCSIAMCTYNGEKYIKEQLESIINQSTQPDEIIICDDGSTDRTIDIVKAVLKSWNGRWRVFENEHNLGYKKNFQKAISLCGSDIIFLSDQDDVWNANKIEIMMKVFQDNPYILLAFHDSEIVDDHLNCIKKSFWNILKFNPDNFFKENYSRLNYNNVVQGAACGFRKELFELSLPFADEAVHDEWLALNAVLYGKVWPVRKQLLKYRQTGDNEIGGTKEDSVTKLKKWSFTLKKAIIAHKNNIKRRKFVWYTLLLNYKNKRGVENCSLNNHYAFLVARLQCIDNKKYFALPFRKYWSTYKNSYYSVKEYIKDLLACSF